MIQAAFASGAPPADDELLASRGAEAEDDVEPFRGKTWQEIARDDLDAHYYALFWFSPQAFHYYLPAFLRGALANPDADFVTTILQLLDPAADPVRERFREERWSRLDESQVRALEKWLGHLLDGAPPGGVFQGELRRALQHVQDRVWWPSA